MARTAIEWTDYSWNPMVGCSKISEGCKNCYALHMTKRLEAMGLKKYAGLIQSIDSDPNWTGIVRLDEKSLNKPIKWKVPCYVFVNSMSDLFHENVSPLFIFRIWEIMCKANWHIYQILTKRADRMLEICKLLDLKFADHIWLGVSIENSYHLDRLDFLKQIPAKKRVVSFEPLIGPVGTVNFKDIHWVIVGGESGPRARPIQISWVDEIYEQCQEWDIPFFFKQWGGMKRKKNGRIYKGKEWNEKPHPSYHSQQ